jgi:hypothetical protein
MIEGNEDKTPPKPEPQPIPPFDPAQWDQWKERAKRKNPRRIAEGADPDPWY